MGNGESAFIKSLPDDLSQGFDEAECKQIFDNFDKAKTGYLKKDVAIKFLTKYAKEKKISNVKQFAEDTFNRFDKNKDGKLAYSELVRQKVEPKAETKVEKKADPPAASTPQKAAPAASPAKEPVKSEAPPPPKFAPTGSAADIFAAMVKGTKQEGGEVMLEESLDRFFEATGVKIDGISALGISWKLECKTMGEISRAELVKGCEKNKCKTVEEVKALVDRTERALKTDWAQFKPFYLWVFDFAKDGEDRKTLDAETAVGMWEVVLPDQFSLLPKWLKFFQKSNTNTVTKDVWVQLAEFAHQVKGGLQNWQDDGSWPVLIDEFAQHCRG